MFSSHEYDTFYMQSAVWLQAEKKTRYDTDKPCYLLNE